jgi:cell division protein FtsN
MARYNQGPQRQQPAKSAHQPLKQMILVMAAFLSGYFLSAVYDVASFNQWIHTTMIDGYFKKQPAVMVTKASPTPPKPKFEFYTLLAKGEPGVVQEAATAVSTEQERRLGLGPTEQAHQESTSVEVGPRPNLPDASVSSLPQAGELSTEKVNASPPPKMTTTPAEKYTVQLAAFNNRADAEKMKAAMVLKGFVVSISLTEQNHIQWYRVSLGPFSNRGEAEDAQHAMVKRERISGMIRKASA